MRLLWIYLSFSIALVQAEEARLYLQLGHSDFVTSVAVSRDGRWALTGSWDNTARVWDLATGREIRRLEGHSGWVTSVALSPDGRWALTGSYDRTARIWDVATGREVRRLEHPDRVESVAVSADGRLALTGGDDKLVRLWDATTGKEVRRMEGHSGTIYSVALSVDGRWALTGSFDHTTRIWEIATGKEVRRLEGHSESVTSVAFSHDGRWALTGSDDKTARIWEVATGKELHRLEGHSGAITSAAFSPNGRWLLTGSKDETARLWDVTTGQELSQLETRSWITSVAYSKDDAWALIGSSHNTAQVWSLVTGEMTINLQSRSQAVHALAFSRDGQWAVTGSNVTGSDDNYVRVWNLAAGKEVRRLQKSLIDTSGCVAFSPDSHWVLTGNLLGATSVWDLATGQEVRSLAGSMGVMSIAVSSDSQRALISSMDGIPILWDLATGKQIIRMEGHSSYVTSSALSPDGRWALTSSGDKTVRLWDMAIGREIRRLEGHDGTVTSVAISADGRLALTGSTDSTARVWELASGKENRVLKGHSSIVTSVAFSSDGRWALTGSWDKTARIWDVATGNEPHRLSGHTNEVNAVVFSVDGRVALTGSNDGTSRLWDASSGKWLATLVSFRGSGWAVVDPEGRYDAADPDAAPGLHFVAGFDVIELGQLKQRFYTPGLLARIWRGEKLPEIAGLKDVKVVPGVEVQPPPPGSLEATVHLTNRGGGIGKVIVKVNGRELSGPHHENSTDFQVNLADATFSTTGENVIEVFAENGDGVIRSRGTVAAWQHQPRSQPPPPKLFAIVAGVSSYDNPDLNLRYSAKDAVDFGRALELAANGLFGKERTNITVLASGGAQEPTKQNIRQAFERVAREGQGSDVLVVYMAGHGVAARNEQDQYYYLTKEARSTEIDRDAVLRSASVISSPELKEWLSKTNMPLKQVVILDTCAAGAAFGADARDLLPDQIRAIELLKDSTGSWILMGSAANAVSYEANRYAQGLLTYALLQGMQGAALDEERVEVSKLFAFAQRQVEDLARGIGGIQRPVLSAPKGQTFPIGLLREADRGQIHLATLKPQLLRARVFDDNNLDSLKLEPALREQLRAASMPVPRGSVRQEPQIVYLDSVVDEVPDAMIPQIRYSVAGDRVRIRVRLLRHGQPLAEQNLELPMSEAGQLSFAILPEVLALANHTQ